MAFRGRRASDSLLISSLAGGATVAGAAKAANVSERTAHRRLRIPAFKAAIATARAEMTERATALLTTLSTSAALALGELLKADSEAVRLGAARSILELGARLRETGELEARIAALESGGVSDYAEPTIIPRRAS